MRWNNSPRELVIDIFKFSINYLLERYQSNISLFITPIYELISMVNKDFSWLFQSLFLQSFLSQLNLYTDQNFRIDNIFLYFSVIVFVQNTNILSEGIMSSYILLLLTLVSLQKGPVTSFKIVKCFSNYY